MRPISFDFQSFVLGAGDNPNTSDMPVAILSHPETDAEVDRENLSRPEGQKMGKPVIVCSCWTPSPEELIEIVKTGRIYIGVMASPDHPTQPPIWALGVNPIENGFKIVDRFRRQDAPIVPETDEEKREAIRKALEGVEPTTEGPDYIKKAHEAEGFVNKVKGDR